MAEARLSAPVKQPARKKPSKRRLVFALVVLLGLGGAGFVFRHSPLIQRFTGEGYAATKQLPARAFPRPQWGSAVFAETVFSIGSENGATVSGEMRIEYDVNFEAMLQRFELSNTDRSFDRGILGSPINNSADNRIVYVDQTSTYVGGTELNDQWIRKPQGPSSNADVTLHREAIPMYQDIVDSSLRARTPTSVTEGTLYDTEVTTYTFEMPLSELPEGSPGATAAFPDLHWNAEPSTPVTLTFSVDPDWVVRYLDLTVDPSAVLEHSEATASPATALYRIEYEVKALSMDPGDLALPTNVVDAAPETTTGP